MIKNLAIFTLSSSSVLILLLLERMVGIGWDYHRDAVTYAEDSFTIVDGILARGVIAIPNGGYYFIASFFDQNIYLITAYNIVLFSLTNVYFTKFHWNFIRDQRRLLTYTLLFLLFNPYRMHLASTVLKDTTVIFLVTLIFYYFPNRKFIAISTFFPLFLIRVVSAVYLAILVPLRYWKFLFIPALLLALSFSDIVVDRLDASNEVSLKNREYDNMPTFQEYGYLGSLLRGILWPFLALTGTFFIFTPAPAFFFCCCRQLYEYVLCLESSTKISRNALCVCSHVHSGCFGARLRFLYTIRVSISCIIPINCIVLSRPV